MSEYASGGGRHGDPHPVDLLADLASGVLPPESSTEVTAHLASCSTCDADYRAWLATAGATRERAVLRAPSAALAARVAGAVAGAAAERHAPTFGRRVRWLARFVLAQLPLVRRDIWPASGVVVGIGAAVSLLPDRAALPGGALALFAPLAAAIGIAMIYGQENDPSLELALSTPTSPRLVVLARLVLVLAFDLALALGASVVLIAIHGPSIALPVVGLWLGPMLLLGCLSLVLSLVVGTSSAIAIGGLLWAFRAVEITDPPRVQLLGGLTGALDAIWQTSPLTLTLAVAALAVALALAPRFERVGAAGSVGAL